MVSQREKMRTSANIRRWSANCRLSSMLILYMPLLCSFYAYCEARGTLTQGECISDNGETLVSAGGRFEFGFFSLTGSSGNNRYVGIWYHEWDNRTVVWVANRDSPIINANGVFNLTEDGQLKVMDTTGKEYWSTYIRSSCPCNRAVTLKNSGNLVNRHYGVLNNILWESFNTSTNIFDTTDTLLPGMAMNQEALSLTSWKGSDDPGEGSYTFRNFENVNIIYKGGNIYCNHFSSDQMDAKLRNLSRDFTARIVMDFSGKLEYWRWDVKGMNWSSVIAEPGNKCAVNNYCGNYGVCNPGNNLVCKCLPGFKPNAPEKWHSGDFSNGCARNSVLCGENDMFFPVYMMSEYDNVKKVPVEGESACKEKCLNSCDCKAYYIDKYTDVWVANRDRPIINANEVFNLTEDGQLKVMDTTRKEYWSTDIRSSCPCNRAVTLKNSGNLVYRDYGVLNNILWKSFNTSTDDRSIMTRDPVDLREYADGHLNVYFGYARGSSKRPSFHSGQITRSSLSYHVQTCKPCGKNMIPYPLSTGPSCGDPNYLSFNCNTTSGRVSFIAPSGTYRVVFIDPDTRSFFIQGKDKGYLRLNQSLPFNLASSRNFGSENSTEVTDEINEIVWEPPLEPICNSSAYCNDWSHSTCKSARDGKRRCLCTFSYRWDGAMLKCRKG